MNAVKRICTFSAFLTLILIGLGGFVRATGAGLSCPDWPLCFGKLLPPTMGDGVAQEWIHRVIGATVGFLSLVLVAISWKGKEENKHFWVLSLVMFFLVGIQGVMGGLTVLMHLNPYIVTTHLALGTIFFQLLALVAIYVGKSSAEEVQVSKKYLRSMQLLLLLTFLQMILGGFVGASGASLACPDFPMCFGEILPENYGGAHLVHMLHRGVGILLLLLGLGLCVATFRSDIEKGGKMHFFGVFFLFIVQIVLGISNIVFVLPIVSAVGHLVVAQMILLGLLVFYCRLRPQAWIKRFVSIE